MITGVGVRRDCMITKFGFVLISRDRATIASAPRRR